MTARVPCLFDPGSQSCGASPDRRVWQLFAISLFRRLPFSVVMIKEGAMKALAILTAAAVTLFSVAAFAQYGAPYGKGKAPPPPPVVTKG
jgi:hypothetical protein